MINTDSIITEFVREHMFKMGISTLQDYLKRVRNFLKFVNKSINDINSTDIKLWIDYRNKNSIGKDKRALRIFLNFCSERGYSQCSWNQTEFVRNDTKKGGIKSENSVAG